MYSVFFSLFKITFEVLDKPIAIPFKLKSNFWYDEIISCECIEKKILVKYGSKYFKLILNATLTVIALYLIWNSIMMSKVLDNLNLFA